MVWIHREEFETNTVKALMRSRGAGRAKNNKNNSEGGTAAQTVGDALMLRSGASSGDPMRRRSGGSDWAMCYNISRGGTPSFVAIGGKMSESGATWSETRSRRAIESAT